MIFLEFYEFLIVKMLLFLTGSCYFWFLNVFDYIYRKLANTFGCSRLCYQIRKYSVQIFLPKMLLLKLKVYIWLHSETILAKKNESSVLLATKCIAEISNV